MRSIICWLRRPKGHVLTMLANPGHTLPSEDLAAAAKWEAVRRRKAAEVEASAAGKVAQEDQLQEGCETGPKRVQ